MHNHFFPKDPRLWFHEWANSQAFLYSVFFLCYAFNSVTERSHFCKFFSGIIMVTFSGFFKLTLGFLTELNQSLFKLSSRLNEVLCEIDAPNTPLASWYNMFVNESTTWFIDSIDNEDILDVRWHSCAHAFKSCVQNSGIFSLFHLSLYAFIFLKLYFV